MFWYFESPDINLLKSDNTIFLWNLCDNKNTKAYTIVKISIKCTVNNKTKENKKKNNIFKL